MLAASVIITKRHVARIETQNQRLLQKDIGGGDGRNREPDGREGRAEREIQALLQIVAASRPDGRESLPAVSTMRAMMTPLTPGGAPTAATPALTSMAKSLASKTTAASATQRKSVEMTSLPPARRVGVGRRMLTGKIVAMPHGLGEDERRHREQSIAKLMKASWLVE